jgi:hypothetical protein
VFTATAFAEATTDRHPRRLPCRAEALAKAGTATKLAANAGFVILNEVKNL